MNLVAERTKARRLAIGLTQGQLSAQLEEATDGGWNPTTQEVLRIEAGTRTCIDLEVDALARVLKVTAEWLLYGDKGDK